MKLLEYGPPIVNTQSPVDIIQILEERLSLQRQQHQNARDISIDLIKGVTGYIGKEVVLVSEAVKLSWHHVEPYLNEHVPHGHDLYYLIDQYFNTMFSKPPDMNSSRLRTLHFTSEQIAIAYVDFLKPILLIRNTEYPRVINRAAVELTEEQFLFCRNYTVNKEKKNRTTKFTGYTQ